MRRNAGLVRLPPVRLAGDDLLPRCREGQARAFLTKKPRADEKRIDSAKAVRAIMATTMTALTAALTSQLRFFLPKNETFAKLTVATDINVNADTDIDIYCIDID